MKGALDTIFKISLALLTFLIVIYALIESKFVSNDILKEFTLLGDIQTIIFVMLGMLVLSWVLKKLLVWEIHATLGGKKREGGRGR